MAHNYYGQQPPQQQTPFIQYYQPQNIYQQLGKQQPQPGQRQQQPLLLGQYQPQPPQIQPAPVLQIQPAPVSQVQPAVQAQSVVVYQRQQQQQQQQQPQQQFPPAQTGYYPFSQQQQQPSSIFPQWSQNQTQPQPPPHIQGALPTPGYIQTTQPQVPLHTPQLPVQPPNHPPAQPLSRAPTQRRPLPQPDSAPKPFPSTPAPATRSRPLPTPTPGPSKSSRTPSPVKSGQESDSVKSNTSEIIRRGRASPPRFSTGPLPTKSAYTPSPSPPSSASSLSQDSVSGEINGIVAAKSPVRPAASKAGLSTQNTPTAPRTTTISTNNATPTQAAANTPPSAPSSPTKFVPMWKRSIPDVLPPLYPTPEAAAAATGLTNVPPQLLKNAPPPARTEKSPTRAPQPPPRQAQPPARQAKPQKPARQIAPKPVARPAQPVIKQPPQQAARRQPQAAPQPSFASGSRFPPHPPPSQFTPSPPPSHFSGQPPPQFSAQSQRQQPTRSQPQPPPAQFARTPQTNMHISRYQDQQYEDGDEEDEDDDEEEEDEDEEDEEGEEESHDSDEYEYNPRHGYAVQQEPPSPQYGIRDLPGRANGNAFNDPSRSGVGALPQPPAMVRHGQGRAPPTINTNTNNWTPNSNSGLGSWNPPPVSPTWNTSPTRGNASTGGPANARNTATKAGSGGWNTQVWDRPTSSMTMAIAAGGTGGGGDTNRNESQNNARQQWPADLPRLPRTPGSSNAGGSSMGGWQGRDRDGGQRQGERRQLSLDDAPPPTVLRRTPEPEIQQQRRELPRPQKGRPQSQMYTSQPTPPNGGTRPRPQSQIYGTGSGAGGGRNHQGGDESDTSEWDAGGLATMRAMAESLREQYADAPPSSQRRGGQSEFADRRPSIPIESPAPVGGRDKMPDLPRMEMESESGDEFVGGYRGQGRNDRNQNNHHDRPGGNAQYTPSHSPDKRWRGGNGRHEFESEGQGPMINVQEFNVPTINLQGDDGGGGHRGGGRDNSGVQINVFEVPGISVAGPSSGVPEINVSGSAGDELVESRPHLHQRPKPQQARRRGGLICGGCDGAIVGRIVNAMGQRWHPACFTCTVCHTLLEHVSSYEHEGNAYCHLDYYENFAPRCYTCKTAIIEERFISLDDPGLGKRTYHEQHFFCAECGDPFLAPSSAASSRTGELNVSGDGEFESDDVGFTVYRGHPYCEACHVRLRLPKCKRCKRSIRDSDEAVEALGGKWCWACFVCDGCQKPFDDPSFFQRGDKPYCEPCFSIMLRNEV